MPHALSVYQSAPRGRCRLPLGARNAWRRSASRKDGGMIPRSKKQKTHEQRWQLPVPHAGTRANGIAPCAVCRLSSSPTRGRCREGDPRGMRLVLLPVWIGGATFRGGERKLGPGRRTIPSGSAVRRSALVELRHPSRLRVAVECRKSISAVGPVRISRRPVHRGGDDRGRVRGGGGRRGGAL